MIPQFWCSSCLTLITLHIAKMKIVVALSSVVFFLATLGSSALSEWNHISVLTYLRYILYGSAIEHLALKISTFDVKVMHSGSPY